MFHNRYSRTVVCCVFSILILLTLLSPQAGYAQTSDDQQRLKKQLEEFVHQQNYVGALPVLEKLLVYEPNNPDLYFYLGFAELAKGQITAGSGERKDLRIRARNTFLRAKELGNTQTVLDALIQSLPLDGSDGPAFTQNKEANDLMNQAEASFSQGKLDDALAGYRKALQLDPKLYHAALFSGDVYTQQGNFAQAEIWYQKAIAIDPNKETAYRYSATPLMKQQKYDQARDRYVEALIVEPYSKFAAAGLAQWAQQTKTILAHPAIDIPTNVAFDEKGDVKATLSDATLRGGHDDGSFAWISYGATRSLWHKSKFARTFPNETTYRHSLAEEVDALHAVLSLASSDQQAKSVSPSLAKLKELSDQGLLEAYILLAKADAGISQDYPAYLKYNRDKLRTYVVRYFVTGGGK